MDSSCKPGKVTVTDHPNDDVPVSTKCDAETSEAEMKKEFLVVFVLDKTTIGACAPDIPGCFAIAPTLEETRLIYIESADDYLRCMAEDHNPIPQPVTTIYDFERNIPGAGSLDKVLHELRLRMNESWSSALKAWPRMDANCQCQRQRALILRRFGMRR